MVPALELKVPTMARTEETSATSWRPLSTGAGDATAAKPPKVSKEISAVEKNIVQR